MMTTENGEIVMLGHNRRMSGAECLAALVVYLGVNGCSLVF